MKIIIAIVFSQIFLVLGCSKKDASKIKLSESITLEPSSENIIEKLIKNDLLRVDINFIQIRSSPEFKGEEYMDWSDSEIGCTLTLKNFSSQNLKLKLESFTRYDCINIVRISDGEHVASLSATLPRGLTESKYFTLTANEIREFYVQYEAFECFHGTITKDNSVIYDYSGDFEIFHELFPQDRLTFSISQDGIIRPRFDMKIQDYN